MYFCKLSGENWEDLLWIVHKNIIESGGEEGEYESEIFFGEIE